MTPDLPDGELRRLYLDWCSTQVARRFLELSSDDVWLRSNLAASLPAGEGTQPSEFPSSMLTAERIPGYLDLVRRTTLLLAEEMDLPDFKSWKEMYRKDPAAYEDDILSR